LVSCLALSATAGAALKTLKHGMQQAVTSRKPEATLAAWEVLEKGGNAFDAIVAGQAALAMTDPAMNGLGSDMVALIYEGATGKVVSLNAEGTAPKLATIEWYEKNNNGEIPQNDGLLSGTVPGIVHAWCTLLDRWGTMTLAEALQPAIRLAEEGFPLPPSMINYMKSEKLKKYPSSVALYHPERDWKPGDILRNPPVAQTMRKLVAAEQAALKAGRSRSEALAAARDRFYKGDLAREFADFSEQNGGLFRYEDFADYTVNIEEPVSLDYRGYTVYANPSSTQGPTQLFWLGLLRGWDLSKFKHNSPEYLHLMLETCKLAYADREFLGDMDFIRIPYKGLLSEAYLAERRKLVDLTKANNDLRIGDPWKYEAPASAGTAFQVASLGNPSDADWALHDGDTSHISVTDRWGNVIAMTPSLHSGWGTGVVMGTTGICFNCRGDFYELKPDHANALQPGKRPRSTLQTILVTKDGKPFFAGGSPGGDDQPQRMIQCFVNVVDFGMNLQDAIEAPRFNSSSFPSSVFPHTMYPGRVRFEDRIPLETQKALEAMGHKVTFPAAGGWTLGAQCAILWDQARGVLMAGADPRGDNDALAK
jgi:gamma-glutamyltranspeptidase/glutathione hydrolase